PDEDTGKALSIHPLDAERGFEAVDLATVSVAFHRDVEQSESLLVGHPVGDVFGEHDHARAGGERRETAANRFAQRLEESDPLHQHRHRRALATWQHDAVQAFEVLTILDHARARALT